jgi:hypothetical protein
MKVKLLSQAKKDLLDIFNYYDKEQNDLMFAITVYNDLLDETERLGKLKDVINTSPMYTSKRGNVYYSHIVSKRKNYKLIYTQSGDIVYVFLIWDCRQNPQKLKDKIKGR